MTERVVRIDLPWARPPLTLNGGRGTTRGATFAHGRKVRDVRTTMLALAAAAELPRGLDHITVQLYYRPRDRGRRDVDNLVATLKPLADALTPGRPARIAKTGRRLAAALIGYGMVPDDTPDYMTKPMPIIVPAERGLGGALWLEITWED